MMIFTKVVHMHDIAFMLGCSPYPFERNDILAALDFKEAVIDVGAARDNDTLKDYEEDLLELYWLFRAQLFNPVEPEIHNTDGDLLEIHQLVYQLNCSPEDALLALKSLAQGFDAADFHQSAVYNDAGDLLKIGFPWLKKSSCQRDDWENTVMGHITLEPNKMMVEVNSRERATSIKRRIAQRLNNGRAQLLVDEIQSLESVMADSMNEAPATSTTFEGEDEALVAIKAQAEWAHWRKWIDTAIPALDGLTPKQAAKSQRGKSRLESLLATFDFSTPEQSRWLHEQLGVDD